MQALIEGTRLADRYALRKRIGEGGMAELWLARDERADSPVVVKILKASLLERPGQRELFRKEWQTASRLMHAQIVRVFEFHDEGDRPFYAQQYIDGPDLGELGSEELGSVLPAVALIADALRYAHGKGVVHRDIKAGNVLLDQRGAPYLIDFGIADAVSGGTPASASPQQLSGSRPTPADDIYALGVLLHEIITATPPPAGGQPLSLRRQSGEPVPAEVADLVGAMLANDPDDRPDAEEVRDRLAAAGFAPAAARLPARLRQRASDTAPDEIRIQSVQPTARAAAAVRRVPADRDERRGLSPRLVYGGLAVLVALLLGVTFLLPDAVDRDAAQEAGGQTAGEAASVATVADDDADGDTADVAPEAGIDGGAPGFSENLAPSGAAEGVRAKLAADDALGDLLSQLERLKYRGIERWGGQGYLDALDVYAAGDEAYLNKNYASAADRYARAADMLDPFFDRIDEEFEKAMRGAREAFDRQDAIDAVRLYDLAVAITPGNPDAEQGLERARNLESVLDLMAQGRQFLDELELEAAKLAFEKALDLDPLWEPARQAIAEVSARITQRSFESRMTEGFAALAAQDFATARAAFNAAKTIFPDSPEPRDGLLQLDQEVRLYRIATLESEATAQEASEQWETAVNTYEALLEVDADLAFAQDGLARARGRAALHQRIQGYIDEPDALSDPVNMQQATQLLLDLSRMADSGPRLEDQKEVLARLLKRAATPVTVELVSDNATDVSVYRVGKLGAFQSRELELRPGNYVAVGVRPGYRDVRREFRVAPEVDMQPIVVRCEEPI
jgi:hypothetical protein